jgi:hypothetical protein
MKQFLFLVVFILTSSYSLAQTKLDEHLLDGTSFDTNYKSGHRSHVEFKNGQIISKWIAGPGQDVTGTESYRSKKIADKMYVVNYLKTPSHSFVTLILDFNQNIVHASAIRGVGTNDEAIFLEDATIEHPYLKE